MATLDKAISLIDGLLADLKTRPSSSGNTSGHPKAPKASGKPCAAAKGAATKATPEKTANAPGTADPELFGAANIQVGRCVSVTDHPNSDKLIKVEVEIGNGELKKVCAGLKQFIPKEELQGSLVCVIVNLKPAKLGGEPSEAMILAADTPSKDPEKPIVRILQPPESAKPGDQIYLEGGSPSTSMPKTLKSDKWKKIVPLLAARGGFASYAESRMVVPDGPITLPKDIPDGAGIH